jgi:sugar phosphate isomerase/epimerase
MGPEFSLAHLTVLGTTPVELIDIAAAAGYDYASIRATPVAPGERVTPLAGDPSMVRQVVHRVADTGVRVLDVELARIGPDEEPDRYVEVLEAAAEVGARHVISQLPDPDRSRATDRFGRLCDLALDYGLTVDL